MCNINFDADRNNIWDREGRAAAEDFILGHTGSDFIFSVLYCNFNFIMLLFFLSLLYNFSFSEGGVGVSFSKNKNMCIVLLCKGLSSPSFSLSPYLP